MKQNATAKRENLRQELIYNTTPGEVRLFEGDVVQLDGGPHIVTKSNHAGATCVPLQGRNVGGETLGGKKFAFVQPGRTQHISGCVPKYLVLERRGDEWLGYSTCSVLKALGKAGASVAHARAIAAEAGVKAKDATVQLNVSAGRRGDGKIAPLTAAQVKELLASAPEPEAEGEAK